MTIQIDTREHKKEVDRITGQLDALGVSWFKSKLYVGDYQSLDNPRLVVDRKKDLLEIVGNITQQHERFVAELVRAQKNGIQIVVLCENGEGIEVLEDVYFWDNPRSKIREWAVVNGRSMMVPKYPRATTGKQLFKSMMTMQNEYGVIFKFCDKQHTGERIVEILGGRHG